MEKVEATTETRLPAAAPRIVPVCQSAMEVDPIARLEGAARRPEPVDCVYGQSAVWSLPGFGLYCQM
jgi:hypothetical protein